MFPLACSVGFTFQESLERLINWVSLWLFISNSGTQFLQCSILRGPLRTVYIGTIRVWRG